MEGIRNYLVSVVAVCMITVPAIVFVRKDALQKTVKLVGGVMILLVAIRPLLQIDLKEVAMQMEQFASQYQLDSSEIRENTQSKIAECVKESTQKVIEEKATELGGMLQAEVRVSDGELPVPVHVKLTGSITPEQLQEMKAFLCSAIQIPFEEQEWNIYGTG